MYNIVISNGSRQDLIHYIQKMKSEKKFKVIDVGGSVRGWSSPIVDAIVDFNEPEVSHDNLQFFKSDITDPNSWNEILEHVEKNGKYDFSICSHTLEDIMNPKFVCEQLSKISKEGYIAVPSKYLELSRHVEHFYRGHIHHRWIFTIQNNIFVGYPKINCIEYIDEYDTIASLDDHKKDLSFYWKDHIPIEYLNHNYLGPSVNHVLTYYRALCHEDDCDNL